MFYDVMIEPQNMTENRHLPEECSLPSEELWYVNMIPSEAVTLVDFRLSRDQYLPNPFRHYIRLSDDLYPLNWRLNRTKL